VLAMKAYVGAEV